MAKQKDGPNKSQAIRDLLNANPKMKAKEIVSTLAGKGIKTNVGLVYMVKGHIKGRKGRKARKRKLTAQAVTVAASSGMGDAVGVVLKVKGVAAEIGGLKKLKALVKAFSS